MKVCRIGVLGTGRGKKMMHYCAHAEHAKLVAVCDKAQHGIEQVKAELNAEGIAFFSDFEEFLQYDMDVVLLANYANEHAPFAIKALEAGKHVISEVVPVQTMAEAVALVEAIERTGKKYCFAENYCFYGVPLEMKRRFDAGELGEFEYGEGEYMHNCENGWFRLTQGNPNHWRNLISAFFYCTHSVGPLLHIAGQRPKKVTGFELPFNSRMANMGARAGHAAIEMVTLENGAVIKSLHGLGCSRSSTWFSVYGSKGRIEGAREDPENGTSHKYYINTDDRKENGEERVESGYPVPAVTVPEGFPGGSDYTKSYSAVDDYTCLHYAVEYFMGDEEAEVIGIYEALDMWMCGFFGYLSCLDGGVPKEIPDLRDPAVRERYRHDRRCTDPKAAGDQLLPGSSFGTPEIPDTVYAGHRAQWEAWLKAQR